MNTNRRVVLAERPRYIVPTANCFRMDEGPVPGEPGEGEVLLRTLWLAMEGTLYAKVQRITSLQRLEEQLRGLRSRCSRSETVGNCAILSGLSSGEGSARVLPA